MEWGKRTLVFALIVSCLLWSCASLCSFYHAPSCLYNSTSISILQEPLSLSATDLPKSISICHQSSCAPFFNQSRSLEESEDCITSIELTWFLCNSSSLASCNEINPALISTIRTTSTQPCSTTTYPLYSCLCKSIPSLFDFSPALASSLPPLSNLTLGLSITNLLASSASEDAITVFTDCNEGTCLENTCQFNFLSQDSASCLEPETSMYLPFSGPQQYSEIVSSNISSVELCLSPGLSNSLCGGVNGNASSSSGDCLTSAIHLQWNVCYFTESGTNITVDADSTREFWDSPYYCGTREIHCLDAITGIWSNIQMPCNQNNSIVNQTYCYTVPVPSPSNLTGSTVPLSAYFIELSIVQTNSTGSISIDVSCNPKPSPTKSPSASSSAYIISSSSPSSTYVPSASGQPSTVSATGVSTSASSIVSSPITSARPAVTITYAATPSLAGTQNPASTVPDSSSSSSSSSTLRSIVFALNKIFA